MLGFFFFFHGVQDVGALLGFVWERGCLLKARSLECGWPHTAQAAVFFPLIAQGSPELLGPRSPSLLESLTSPLSSAILRSMLERAPSSSSRSSDMRPNSSWCVSFRMLSCRDITQPGHQGPPGYMPEVVPEVSTSQGNGAPGTGSRLNLATLCFRCLSPPTTPQSGPLVPALDWVSTLSTMGIKSEL